MSKEEQREKAVTTLDTYLDGKKKNVVTDEIIFDEEHVKSFEENFGSKKSRWSLMARVYQDSSIPYEDRSLRWDYLPELWQEVSAEPSWQDYFLPCGGESPEVFSPTRPDLDQFCPCEI